MKNLISVFVVSALAFSLAACAGNPAEPAEPAAVQNESPAESAEGQPGDSPGLRDRSAMLDENMLGEKILYGEVYEIYGNFITLKLIEWSNMGMSANMDMGDELPDWVPEEYKDMSFEEFSEMMKSSSIGPARSSSDQPPGGPDDSQSGSVQGGFPIGQGERPEPNYTGEERDIVIPVGVPVMTTTRGENGLVESEVKLETIKAGDTLIVTLAEDGETVEKVTLMQGGGMIMNITGGPPGAGAPAGQTQSYGEAFFYSDTED